MEKGNKMILGYGFFIIVISFIVIYGFFSFNRFYNITGLDYDTITHSTPVEFESIGKTIFVTTRKWGLGGQHSHTIISDIDRKNKKVLINKEKEIVFDEICGLYYKVQEPDSLLVFFSSRSYSEEEILYREIGSIKVKITKYKATMDKHYKNYKDLGLSLVSCYDGKK